jgi:hypothetical protein
MDSQTRSTFEELTLKLVQLLAYKARQCQSQNCFLGDPKAAKFEKLIWIRNLIQTHQQLQSIERKFNVANPTSKAVQLLVEELQINYKDLLSKHPDTNKDGQVILAKSRRNSPKAVKKEVKLKFFMPPKESQQSDNRIKQNSN